MNDRDKVRFGVAMTKLFAGAQSTEPSPVELEAYWETLEEFPIDVVERACRIARREGRGYRPTEGDVYEVARRFRPEANGHRQTERFCAQLVEWRRKCGWPLQLNSAKAAR